MNLGVIFQMQDDVLDCFGQKGRQIGADLCEGKVSILVVHHLSCAPEQSLQIIQLLRQDRLAIPQSKVLAMIEDFRNSGALTASLRDIQQLCSMVISAPVLQSNPMLLKIVTDLLERILAPIKHLFADMP